MSNVHSKYNYKSTLSKSGFFNIRKNLTFSKRLVYNSRKLSLATRIEIIRKRYLIREAKKLLNHGLSNKSLEITSTPRPSTMIEEYNNEETVSFKSLAQILEEKNNHVKEQTFKANAQSDKDKLSIQINSSNTKSKTLLDESVKQNLDNTSDTKHDTNDDDIEVVNSENCYGSEYQKDCDLCDSELTVNTQLLNLVDEKPILI